MALCNETLNYYQQHVRLNTKLRKQTTSGHEERVDREDCKEHGDEWGTDYRLQGQTLATVIVDIATPPTGKQLIR